MRIFSSRVSFCLGEGGTAWAGTCEGALGEEGGGGERDWRCARVGTGLVKSV